MISMTKQLTIVVPVYNEERNIVPVFNALTRVMAEVPAYEWNVLFVDDGSRDASFLEMERLSRAESRVSYLELSRNFGKEIATTAGLMHATGDGVVLMDADLQHPPELIPQFIQHWEAGADIVIGLRAHNKGEGWIKFLGSKLFYRLMRAMSETELLQGETDFRLIDRRVVEEFKGFTERNRMTRALLNWLGFKKTYVTFSANARTQGQAGYSPLKLVRLALNSFISHSLFPLKIAGYLGLFITFFAGTGGLFILVEKYALDDRWNFRFSGPAILAVINLFLVGIILMCLGLVALYVGSIHAEVVGRPMFVVRRRNVGRNE